MPLHRIREIRLRQQLGCRTLGSKIGMSEGEFSQFERQDDVKLFQLVKIAQALGVPIAELIRDEPNDELLRLRGFVLRVVKSANTLIERLEAGDCQNLALELRREAVEMMPEAAAVDGTYPNRRHWDDHQRIGRIAEHPVPLGDEANFYQSSAWQDP